MAFNNLSRNTRVTSEELSSLLLFIAPLAVMLESGIHSQSFRERWGPALLHAFGTRSAFNGEEIAVRRYEAAA